MIWSLPSRLAVGASYQRKDTTGYNTYSPSTLPKGALEGSMAANEQERIKELLLWCEQEDIWIHPALEIKSVYFKTVRYVA